jgi:nucleoside-diphosphate-sugar epimerase
VRSLVTGYNGFVGKNLCERLRREGIEVIEFRPDKGNDLNVDYIFHCAAELYDESKMIESNISLTRRLLEETKDIDYKAFIYIGSSSEYGKVNHPITEHDPINPTNIYEITKSTGSIMCRVFAEKLDKPIVVVRPFSLYGPHERECRLIPTIYNNIVKGKTTELYPGVHDWVSIQDFVDALMKIATSGPGKIKGDIINVGTGVMTKNIEVFLNFTKIIGWAPCNLNETKFLRKYDSNYWVCNPTYARVVYGIQCKTSLHEGLKKYVEWRRNG